MKCEENAYAKVNITLAVGAKRPDGYHDVTSVMQRLSLCDTLTVSPASHGITLTCSDPTLPTGEGNLAYRAAELFLRTLHLRGGVTLSLEKRIPSQAGLGGGSSDAAAVLCALRRLFAPDLPDTALETMAAALGSDVPFFIRGGTQLAEGRGERLTPLPPLQDGWFVLVKPPESFSTPTMYRLLDARPAPDAPPLPPLQAGLPALAAGLFNSFEYAVPAESDVWRVKSRLVERGALATLLSGSGSAVFGLFDDEAVARAAAAALRATWPETFLTRPV